MAPVLELRHITCGYDPEEPPALRGVSLALEPGERLALVGPNGAGKSTLFLAALGLLPLSAGEIWLEGKKLDIKDPNVAHQLGISIVHQELVQFPDMTIMENIYMGRYPKKNGLVDFKELFPVVKQNSAAAEIGSLQCFGNIVLRIF